MRARSSPAGLGRQISLCDLRPLRNESAAELSSMRAQSVGMDIQVTAAFDAALTVPTVTSDVEFTLG